MKYSVKPILTALFLLSCFQALGQPSYLLNKPYSSKYRYVDGLGDSLFWLPSIEKSTLYVQGLAEWAKANNDGELETLLRLLISRLNFNNRSINNSETSLKELLLAKNTQSKFVNCELLQTIGEFYYHKCGKNSLAFEYYLQAYNNYRNFVSEEFPSKRKNLYELGGAYFRYEDYNAAIHFLKLALDPKIVDKENLKSTIYNTIGMSYMRMHRLDSSLFYFNIALEDATTKKDQIWIGIFEGNIGTIYYEQGKLREAAPLLQRSAESSVVYKQRRNAISTLSLLADAYLTLGKNEEAELSIAKARLLQQEVQLRNSYTESELLYRIAAKINASKGNAALVYTFCDSAMQAKDSATHKQLESNQAKANDFVQFIQGKQNQERLESQRSKELLLRNSLIIIILLLSALGILFINRQRMQKKNLTMEKEKAEAELDAATAKLISFRQSVDEKNELLYQYSGKIEQLQKDGDEQENSEVRAQLETAILLTDEQWEEFRKLFEKVHGGFINNLKKKIPDLTSTEIRFLALSKLQLTNKEMASMLGVSPNTIRIYKFRLRKKLNMDKDGSIEDWLAAI